VMISAERTGAPPPPAHVPSPAAPAPAATTPAAAPAAATPEVSARGEPAPSPPRPPAALRDDGAPPSSAKRLAPDGARRAPEPAQLAPTTPEKGTAAPAEAPRTSLGEQLEQLKRARAALRAGEAGRALELIDAYRASPTGGELGAEASLLRIEALALSGQRDVAAREARQFASDYPNSPLIDRALGFAGGAER
jgi:hypothetical protein